MLTQLWKRRIAKLRDHGNGFTYHEMTDILGLSRTNIALKMGEIREEMPGALGEKDRDGSKEFHFDYDALLNGDDGKEDEPDLPEWLSRATYDNVYAAFDASLDDGYHLEFEARKDFDARFQRGGLTVFVFEDGQKAPEREHIIRTDNCIVLSI